MEDLLKFGSEEMKKELEANSEYAKFETGKVYVVEVLSSEAKPRIAEFEGKQYNKYDIQVKINVQGEKESSEKTWGVSRKVLKSIADAWGTTKKFNVMLNEKSYSVIPIIDDK